MENVNDNDFISFILQKVTECWFISFNFFFCSNVIRIEFILIRFFHFVAWVAEVSRGGDTSLESFSMCV